MSTRSKTKNKKSLPTTLGKAPECISADLIDISHIGNPIHTSIFGLKQVLTLFQTATEEVQAYVTYECDIMYECRICRTIFRSLANFILHKRNYCLELFRKDNCSNENLSDLESLILSDKEQFKDKEIKDEHHNSNAKSKVKKKLSTILPHLLNLQESALITEECLDDTSLNDIEDLNRNNKNIIALQNITGSESGVFQTALNSDALKADFMKAQVFEIHDILENSEAIIGTNGKIITPNDEKKFACTVCNTKYLTKKTLKYHIKFAHNSMRQVYQCTECTDTFANTWGVFRHLFKIHRKTSAQVKRLRSQIYSNKIQKDEVIGKSCSDEPEVTLNCQEILNIQNQQWITDLESDNDIQICGGCGRKFERKAALHSHSQFCTKRIALRSSIKENSTKRLQEEKGKIYKNNKQFEVVRKAVQGSSRRKQLVARKIFKIDYSKDNDNSSNALGNDELTVKENNIIENENSTVNEINSDACFSSEINEELINSIPIENNKVIFKEEVVHPISHSNIVKRKMPLDSSTDTVAKKKCKESRALNLKCAKYVDKIKMSCLPCDRVFKSNKSLMKHMAVHFNWNRYQCKDCKYMSYQKSKCEHHVEKVHSIIDKNVLNQHILCIPLKKTKELSSNFVRLVKKRDHLSNKTMEEKNTSSSVVLNSEELNKPVEELISEKQIDETIEVKKIDENEKVEEPEKVDVVEKVDQVTNDQTSAVRNMIMEVIFGNTNATKIPPIQQSPEFYEELEGIYNNLEIQEINSALPLRDPRPVRNRTATVKEDFLYDMTQILKAKSTKSKESSPDLIRKPLKIYTRKKKQNLSQDKLKLAEDINMNNKTIQLGNNLE